MKSPIKYELPETHITIQTPTIIRLDKFTAALMERNLCDHVLNLNLDILHDKNIIIKYLGLEGLYLNKLGNTKLRKRCWSLEQINESPGSGLRILQISCLENIASIKNKFDLHMNTIKNEIVNFMMSDTKTYTVSFQYLNILWQITHIFSGLNRRTVGVECFYLSGKILVVKKLKQPAMLILRGVFVVIEMVKKEWLHFCSYNPHKSNIKASPKHL